MHHHHEKTPFDLSISSPALLSVHNSVLDRNEERIMERYACQLEADAVLPLIGEIFRFIPLEPQTCHCNSITTILQCSNILLGPLLNPPLLQSNRLKTLHFT